MQLTAPLPSTDLGNRIALRVGEAARLLGVSPALLWKLIYSPSSTFPSAKVGNSVVIPVKDLQEWLAAQTRPHTNGTEEHTNGTNS